MPSGAVIQKVAAVLLLALALGGCAATYVPISWGMGEKVQELSRSDPTLAVLFNRFDPGRDTLRVSGDSFGEVMMPSEVPYHLGAYRAETKLIYRNLYENYSDRDLRDLMLHEFAHHIWFSAISVNQRKQWQTHLEEHPTPLQTLVRRVYPLPSDHDAEDFAFTVQHARQVDIEELVRMKIITSEERAALIAALQPPRHPAVLQGCALPAATPELAKKAQ
jgi:hypothetical protein